MYRSLSNLTAKNALKLLMFDEVADKNKLAPLYGPRCSVINFQRLSHSQSVIAEASVPSESLQFGVMVTRWSRSTRLTYAEPG